MSRWLSERCDVTLPLEHALRRCVWRASWLRDAEPAAAASQGIDLGQLMERAGLAAYNIFADLYAAHRHWLIVVGPGNNGGDGYVIARLARDAGKMVTVLSMPHSKPLPAEATRAQAAWHAAGGTELSIPEEGLMVIPADVDLVVDGLLGTGISGQPRAHYQSVIAQLNALPVPRVAIDIPSGLNAETGVAAGACIHAAHTASFISLKPGLLTGSAGDYVGLLHYRTLGLAEWLTDPARLSQVAARRVSIDDVGVFFSAIRVSSMHKGRCGKVVLIGGDDGCGGAVLMAAEASLVAGAGLTRVLTRPAYAGPLLCRCPEVMVTTLDTHHNTEKGEEAELEARIREALFWATTIAVGPGLGSGAFARAAVTACLEHAVTNPDKTLILDADALNELSHRVAAKAVLPRLPRSIMTPHPGEAARLLGCTVSEIEKDRLAAAEKLSSVLGGTCLLKGPGTIVYAHKPESEEARRQQQHEPPTEARTYSVPSALSNAAIVDAGNPGMASGGMGDALTGLLAGLAAQRLHDVFDTTCGAALAHGVAADMVVATVGRGTRGLRATEVIAKLPYVLNAQDAAGLRELVDKL